VTQDKTTGKTSITNGEDDWKVPKEGILALTKWVFWREFDGDNFKVVERSQFTDITTKMESLLPYLMTIPRMGHWLG